MRYLFTTDWHICDRRPGTRIDDDFFDTQNAKIEEILAIATAERVDKILHGGDLFDRPLMDLHIINTVIQILKKSAVPIEIVLGNHDLLGYNCGTVARTALGTLLKAGVIRETTLPHVNVTNHHKVELYKTAGPVILTHNMVSPDEVLFEHILCKDIAPQCPNSVVLCGHYHRPFEYKDIEHNTTFINPGSLMRVKINEAKHHPEVIIGEGAKIIKRVKLKSARAGKEIFDLTVHAENKAKEKSFDKFVADLQAAKGTTENCDLETLVAMMSAKEKIDEHIRDEVLRRIQGARTALAS